MKRFFWLTAVILMILLTVGGVGVILIGSIGAAVSGGPRYLLFLLLLAPWFSGGFCLIEWTGNKVEW